MGLWAGLGRQRRSLGRGRGGPLGLHAEAWLAAVCGSRLRSGGARKLERGLARASTTTLRACGSGPQRPEEAVPVVSSFVVLNSLPRKASKRLADKGELEEEVNITLE